MSDEEKQLPLFPNDGLPELLDGPSSEEGKGAVSEEQVLPESQQSPPQEQAETAQIPSENEQQQQEKSPTSPPPLPQEEAYETFIHDPWASVTTAAPTVLTAIGAAETGVPPTASPLPRLTRFTHGRIAAFAAVCLAVVLAFGGGAVALVNAARPTTPAQQPPIQRPTAQSAARSTPPTVTASPIAGGTTTATNPNATTLQDDFQRNDMTNGWGIGSRASGQAWHVTTPERTGAFSVVNNQGKITANQVGPAYYTAVLGPSFQQQNIEVAATLTLPAFDERQTNSGIILHWKDANNYDKLYLDGVQLVLLENLDGKQTTLAVMNFPALDDGTAYVLRFRAEGKTLMAKAWVSGKAEPAAWMLSTTEGKLTAGQVGIRARLQPGNSMRVLAFQIVA